MGFKIAFSNLAGAANTFADTAAATLAKIAELEAGGATVLQVYDGATGDRVELSQLRQRAARDAKRP